MGYLTFLLILCFLPTAHSIYPFKLNVKLNRSYEISINWDLDYESETASFQIELDANTASSAKWLGVGFSEHGDFEQSDLCVVKDAQVMDGYVASSGYVKADEQQDCDLPDMAALPDGRMLVMFSRKFDTCDPRDYVFEHGTTQFVLLLGTSNLMSIHSSHVAKKIVPNRLLRSLKPPEPLPSNTKSTVVGMFEAHIPAEETTYWCTLVQLPQLHTKHHIVKYEAAVQPGNEEFVHHMEVFHCERLADQGRLIPRFSGPCNDPNAPAIITNCKHVIGAWAMGADPYVYPEEAGIPIGGLDYFPFALVEVHYNNPGKKQGVVDSSGIRFYYTHDLRPYDAGIVEVGLIYSDTMAIPPGMVEFPLTGYCTPECTDTALPDDGIVLFGSQLHSHLTGRRLKTVVVRENVEIAEVNRDDHYSPHWQEIRMLEEPVRLLPGDALLTTCVHNTEKRQNVTLGGYGIHDEMCVDYIHYYPKSELEVCKSAIDNSTLRQYFRYLRQHEGQSTDDKASPTDNYKSISWTRDRIEQLARLYKKAPLTMNCFRNSGDSFPGNWNQQHAPKILDSLVGRPPKCYEGGRP